MVFVVVVFDLDLNAGITVRREGIAVVFILLSHVQRF